MKDEEDDAGSVDLVIVQLQILAANGLVASPAVLFIAVLIGFMLHYDLAG